MPFIVLMSGPEVVDEADSAAAEAEDASQVEGTPAPASASGNNGRGRPVSWQWEYFEKIDGSLKACRWDVRCRLCTQKIKAARTYSMADHLATCRGVTPQIRADIAAKSTSIDSTVINNTGTKKKRSRQLTLDSTVSFLAKLDETTRSRANTKLLLFFVNNNVPWMAVDDPHFLEFCQLLCANYCPPGVRTGHVVDQLGTDDEDAPAFKCGAGQQEQAAL